MESILQSNIDFKENKQKSLYQGYENHVHILMNCIEAKFTTYKTI